jgi:hypothetical protein
LLIATAAIIVSGMVKVFPLPLWICLSLPASSAIGKVIREYCRLFFLRPQTGANLGRVYTAGQGVASLQQTERDR